MRKLFILAALLVSALCPRTLSAQVALGVRAGGNFANLTYDNDFTGNQIRHARPSFGAGVFADFSVNETFSLRTGLDYTGMGGKMGYEVTVTLPSSEMTPPITSTFEAVTSLNYITLPVQAMLSWQIAESKFRFNVGAGFFLGFLLKNNSSVELTRIPQDQYSDYYGYVIPGTTIPLTGFDVDGCVILPHSKEPADGMNGLAFGLTGNIGLSYPVGTRGSLSLEYGLNYGLSKVYKQGSDTKTYSSRAMLGYSIRLGK